MDWKWTKKAEAFNERKEHLKELPCLEHFARDRDNILTIIASKTGLGIKQWQKQTHNTMRPKAFASRNLNDAKKNIGLAI